MDENRARNLVWTIAEDYNFIPRLNVFAVDHRYINSLIGYFYRAIEFNTITEFLYKSIYPMENKNIYLSVARLLLENKFYKDLVKIRPGVENFREEYIELLREEFFYRRDYQVLEFSYYNLVQGSGVFENREFYNLALEISKTEFNSAEEYLKELKKIYYDYFKLEFKTLKVQDVANVTDKKKKSRYNNIKKSAVVIDEVETLEKELIESAEFTLPIDDSENENSEKLKNSSKKDRIEAVTKRYGKSIKNPRDLQILEDELCTDIHSGIKLHFTKGEYAEDIKSAYHREMEQNQTQQNKDFYNKSQLVYKRAERNLKEVIKNTLLRDTSTTTDYTTSGKIVPSRIWKIKTENPKIFSHRTKSDEGDIRVIILLDSSASQLGRQSEVAVEAYIISRALVSLNIKTEIYGFSNLFNYLVLKKFHDFNDPLSKVDEVLKYSAGGSNRDGLAIKTMVKLFEGVDARRKILIALSDGLPNDEVNLDPMSGVELTDYKEEVAIMDTAKEVLSAKMVGIDVLGIFTGNPSELSNEKLIFGNDFAYIDDIKKFHDIIGFYFKNKPN